MPSFCYAVSTKLYSWTVRGLSPFSLVVTRNLTVIKAEVTILYRFPFIWNIFGRIFAFFQYLFLLNVCDFFSSPTIWSNEGKTMLKTFQFSEIISNSLRENKSLNFLNNNRNESNGSQSELRISKIWFTCMFTIKGLCLLLMES